MENENRAGGRTPGQRIAAHREQPVVSALARVAARQGNLSFECGGARQSQGLLDSVLDVRTAYQLGDETADGGPVETKKPIGAGIGKEKTAAGINGDDGFGHGAQNHKKLLPILIQPGCLCLDFVGGHVECANQPSHRPLRRDQYRACSFPRPQGLQAPPHFGQGTPPAPAQVKHGCRRYGRRADSKDDHHH